MIQAPERIETERLVGVRISPTDRDDFVSFYTDAAVMELLSATGDPFTVVAATDLFQGHLDHWADHGFGTWVFRDRAGRFVGRAGLKSTALDTGPVVELFYGVVSGRWGEGLATEIAGQIIDVAFGTMGVDELVAFALPTNTASLRVLAKCGFVRQGEVVHAGLSHGLHRLTAP